jgi:endonuclease/exonuclease/phosphatase family metal-dependent hydrolase
VQEAAHREARSRDGMADGSGFSVPLAGRSAYTAAVRDGRRPPREPEAAPPMTLHHLHATARRPDATLRVASYNVHKCVGTDGHYRPDRVAAVIGEIEADIVALQEVDRRFGRRIGRLDAEAVGRETGLVLLPVSDLPDGHGWHGNALLLRPDIRATVRRLNLPGAEPRGALVADLALPEGALRIVAAHLGLLRSSRARQADALLRAIAEGPDMPTLLLGDLNEWREDSAPLRTLSRFFGPARHSPRSFPARLPLLPLDRILGWPNGIVRRVQAHDSWLARRASDHLPLTAEVDLPAAAVASAAA